ncbi:MAG: UbiA-like polyprenyltransferase [Planctomycetota bacterium]
MSQLQSHLSLVAFSHSIFALPFALQGAWIANRGLPPAMTLLGIVFCAVTARTAAMGFNRLVDRDIDAANPRTAQRELPSGALSPVAVRSLVGISSVLFVAGAFALNPLCGYAAPFVLIVLLGYSYVKRFSEFAHLVLGLALGLAPPAAWLAVRGEITPAAWQPVLLGLAVLCWVSGFDLIYACQDADFDREAGLHSIPAKRGVAFALRLSTLLHVVTLALLVAFGLLAALSWIWWIAVSATALLLAYEHRIVKPGDLSRVDRAFFTINGWIGVGLFLGLVLDLALLSATS